jgi:hypothetical protein
MANIIAEEMFSTSVEEGTLYPTQQEMVETANNFIASDTRNSIQKYLYVKTLEKMCKYILSECPNFIKEVKQEFLKESGGSYNKENVDFYGVSISTKNVTKANTLKKNYEYSPATVQMELDIEFKKNELKALEDTLKSKKLYEINSNIAKEITLNSILGQAVEEYNQEEELNNFQIAVHFKKS